MAREAPAGSEFDIIYRYFAGIGGRGPAVELGVGDDCAILRLSSGERLATSIDTLVEGVHFPADAFPEDLAWRAAAVAASDLAAMGARPLGMTLALTLPQADELWLRAFSEGLSSAAIAFALPLVGGDTTRGPLCISVTVYGALAAGMGLLRSGASPGDRVCVSGPLGDAAAALAMLQGEWRAEGDDASYLEQRYFRPVPRLELGCELLGVASAAIDISDGLLADAGHIAASSGVALQIVPERLPLSAALERCSQRDSVMRWALTGGDDYELCFCLPAAAALPAGCTAIGTVTEGEGVDCGLQLDSPEGYRHF